jgi:hypothetical protein
MQTVNELRKIAWASVFRFKRQHIYIYVNRNFRWFAANGKTETANFPLFSANGKRKFAFLSQQMITVIDVCRFSKRAHL